MACSDSLDLIRELGAKRAHPLGQRAICVLDPPEELGPRREVFESVGVEEHLDLACGTRLVDLDQALRQHRLGTPKAGFGRDKLGAGSLELSG